jgi:signal peptidase I
MSPYLVIVPAALLALGAAVGWLRWRLRIVTVTGESMRPTLAPGDRLLVRRTPLTRIRTGDIVVLAYPDRGEFASSQVAGDNWLIKRAVAVPGDPVPASVAATLSVRPGSPVRDGALIAIGDNRDASFDSRTFGYVLASELLGVVLRPIRTGAH